MKVFFNGSFIEKEDVKISPDDRGFLFGDGVYEVIRSYFGAFFMFDEHIARLKYSLKELGIEYSEANKLKNIARELILLNSFENFDATVYIQITRGVAVRSLKYPSPETKPTVYVTLNKLSEHYYEFKNGISAVLVDDLRWKRCDIKSVNLLANVIAHNQAIEDDAEIGLFVKDGIITEGTHVGVFGVKNGSLITHPAGKEILPSITRKVVFDLCKKLEIPVIEQAINPENVFNLDELFVVGTSPEIAPVISLNKRKISNGVPGPISIMLQNAFSNVIKGK